MTEELTEGAISNIRVMRQIARRSDRPDLVGVELVQEIACIVDRARDLIPDDDCAVLLGIGAVLMCQADAEITAGLAAFSVLERSRKGGAA